MGARCWRRKRQDSQEDRHVRRQDNPGWNQALKAHLSAKTAEKVYAVALMRLTEPMPFKDIAYVYETSYFSLRYPNLGLGASSITRLLREVGMDREPILCINSEWHLGETTKKWLTCATYWALT